MKKFLLILCLLFLFSFTACKNTEDSSSVSDNSTNESYTQELTSEKVANKVVSKIESVVEDIKAETSSNSSNTSSTNSSENASKASSTVTSSNASSNSSVADGSETFEKEISDEELVELESSSSTTSTSTEKPTIKLYEKVHYYGLDGYFAIRGDDKYYDFDPSTIGLNAEDYDFIGRRGSEYFNPEANENILFFFFTNNNDINADSFWAELNSSELIDVNVAY